MTELALDLLRSGLTALAFVALPIALVSVNRHAVRIRPIEEFVQIPLLPKLTITGGIVLGIALASHAATPELVHPAQIFAAAGPWDITFGEFLAERVNPLAFDYAAAAREIESRSVFAKGNVLLAYAGSALAVAIVLCTRTWDGPKAVLAGTVCVMTVACSAYIVFYVCAGLLWALNHLNFLVFLTPFMLTKKYSAFFRKIP